MQKFTVMRNYTDETGFEVEADVFTIEASGVVSFWRIVVRGELSELILAIAPGAWSSVEKAP